MARPDAKLAETPESRPPSCSRFSCCDPVRRVARVGSAAPASSASAPSPRASALAASTRLARACARAARAIAPAASCGRVGARAREPPAAPRAVVVVVVERACAAVALRQVERERDGRGGDGHRRAAREQERAAADAVDERHREHGRGRRRATHTHVLLDRAHARGVEDVRPRTTRDVDAAERLDERERRRHREGLAVRRDELPVHRAVLLGRARPRAAAREARRARRPPRACWTRACTVSRCPGAAASSSAPASNGAMSSSRAHALAPPARVLRGGAGRGRGRPGGGGGERARAGARAASDAGASRPPAPPARALAARGGLGGRVEALAPRAAQRGRHGADAALAVQPADAARAIGRAAVAREPARRVGHEPAEAELRERGQREARVRRAPAAGQLAVDEEERDERAHDEARRHHDGARSRCGRGCDGGAIVSESSVGTTVSDVPTPTPMSPRPK